MHKKQLQRGAGLAQNEIELRVPGSGLLVKRFTTPAKEHCKSLMGLPGLDPDPIKFQSIGFSATHRRGKVIVEKSS
jgi:hypothetical protein